MSLGISGWEKCTLLTKPEQSGKTFLMLQKIVEDLSEEPREDGKKNVNFIICDNNLLLVLQTSERLNTDDKLCRFRNIETGELYSMSSPTETKKMTFPTTEKKIAMKPKMKKEKSAEEITVWEEFQAFKNMKIQKERDAAATMEAEAERVVKEKKWNEENGVEELRSDKEKEIKEFQKKIDTLREEIKEAEGKIRTKNHLVGAASGQKARALERLGLKKNWRRRLREIVINVSVVLRYTLVLERWRRTVRNALRLVGDMRKIRKRTENIGDAVKN